jgi:hypothetical protein
MIIKQRTQEKETYYIELFFAALILVICTFWGINLISVFLSLTFSFFIYWILSSKIRQAIHNKKLKAKMLKEEVS